MYGNVSTLKDFMRHFQSASCVEACLDLSAVHGGGGAHLQEEAPGRRVREVRQVRGLAQRRHQVRARLEISVRIDVHAELRTVVWCKVHVVKLDCYSFSKTLWRNTIPEVAFAVNVLELEARSITLRPQRCSSDGRHESRKQDSAGQHGDSNKTMTLATTVIWRYCWQDP